METGQRFDRIEAKLEEHDRKFEGIEATLEDHGQMLGEHGQKLDRIELRMGRTDELLIDMMKYMNGLSDRVDGLSDRIERHFQIAMEASRSDFRVLAELLRDHSGRIAALEARAS